MGIMRAIMDCGAVDCGTEAVGYGAIRLYRLLYGAMELWAMGTWGFVDYRAVEAMGL
jgi:hypothetical protein